MTKKFAVVLDITPSEQIVDGRHDVKTVGVVIGLRSPKSFEEVGSDFADVTKRLNLKKWAGSSNHYRKSFVGHMAQVVASGTVLCGYAQSNDAEILGAGGRLFQHCFGRFPDEVEISKRGKPRVTLGGYIQDGKLVPPYVVPVLDLCVIGWISACILTLCGSIQSENEAQCKFDIIIDRLPNDQGEFYKATLVRKIVHRLSQATVDVVGVPDTQAVIQRDLFVDNVAGLAHQILKNPNSELAKLVHSSQSKLFSITRPATDQWLEHLNAAMNIK